MKKRSHDIISVCIQHVLRHPGIYVIVACVLTILSVVTIALKFDIHSDIKDLMPQDAPSVVDLYKISDRIGSVTTLDIYIKSEGLAPATQELKQSESYQKCLEELGEDGEEHLLREKPMVGENWCDNGLMVYARDYVELLRGLDSVGNVRFHQDKSFFEKNLLLYATNEELEKAYNEIDQALTEARRQSGEYKACLLTESDPSACDDLKPSMSKTSAGSQVDEAQKTDSTDAFKEMLLDRYRQTELANVREFPIYKMGENTYGVALEVRFKDATTGLKAIKDEVKHIEAKVASMDKSIYGVDIYVEYGGAMMDMQSEYNSIIIDIATSISITILSILLLIAIFFRSIRSSFRIFLPLVMSTLWALGITFLTIGYLNMITAFIFAILIGLGIDFGIHLYARYNQERRHGLGVEESLRVSVVQTGSPLFFGALTTAAAFYTLMFGSFPGFSQFGFVAGTGVLLAFCTMSMIMPAWILVMERKWPSKVPELKQRKWISKEKTIRLAPIVGVCTLITFIGVGFSVYSLDRVQFEDSFYNLNMRSSHKVNKKIDNSVYVKTTRRVTPTVVVLDNYEQVSALELYLRRDIEYEHYERFRLFNIKMPNTMQYLNATFSEALPDLGQYRSMPVISAVARVIPEVAAIHITQFASYGSEKSQALYMYRDFALKMPETASRLVNVMPEIYENNTVANALPVVVGMQRTIPRSLWSAIPKYRSSQQLGTISDFASIFSYLPGTDSQQAERLETIAKIRERTADRQIRFLPETEKAKIQSLRRYLIEQPIHVDDLPEWVKFQFKEGGNHPLAPRPESGLDYAFGNVALMYQTIATYDGAQSEMLAQQTRSLRVDGKPLTASTGAFVYADMLRLVKTDGMEISLIALLVILVIAAIQQRHPVSALLVTLPVLSGLALTLYMMVLFNLKLGLFNIVMLPVILGIGIDGSIYLLQRYQTLGRGSVIQAVRMVLPPVFMSSATTLVGFAGLMTSRHQGLNTMGELAVMGISMCFLTTFLVQPGLVLLVEKLKIRGVVPEKEYSPEELSENKDV